MNREIKFRGKHCVSGHWVLGDLLQKYIHHDGFLTIVEGGCINNKVIPETVGQYTGLKDKNGKEMYEGDILKQVSGTAYRFGDAGIVEYESDYGGFIVNGKYHRNQHHECLTCDVAFESEIVGNIHDNPEIFNNQ